MLVAAGQGHSFESVLAEAGVGSDALLDPERMVPDVIVTKIVALLERAAQGQNLALVLGRRLPVAAMGLGWSLWRRAPTLGVALRLFHASHNLAATALHIELEIEPQPALMFVHPNDLVDGGLGSEVALSIGVRMIRRLFGPGRVTRVEFGHAPRGPAEAYSEAMGVPVVFGTSGNRIVFGVDQLEAPNQAFTVEGEDVLLQQLREMMFDRGLLQVDALREVRAAIIACGERGLFSVADVARQLGMSRRALQRRVEASQESVSGLVDQYRFTRARALLVGGGLPLGEVAEQVGFATERGFRKAFRRWSGTTANQWRAAAAERAADPPGASALAVSRFA